LIELQLPIPPSCNQLWRAGRRKGHFYKSRAYTLWLQEANLLTPKGTPLGAPAEVQIEIHGGKGWTHRRDLDNTNKAIIDLLKWRGYFEDDNTQHVTKISTEYIKPSDPASRAICVVRVLKRH
jgi:Holliday junction resolvase RusA-like endonuclease